jgi:cytochrome c oxidase subunit III
MSVILVFLLVIAGVAGWWLAQHRLMSKPWLEHGPDGLLHEIEPSFPTEKIGLGVFLAVVGALFALFTSAYFMRMELSDWQAPPLPRSLWVNTGILILSSIALHCGVLAARRNDIGNVRLALATGGLTALAFLVGQLFAWRELSADGYFLTVSPATSFFFLLTGMHGLHIIGGLVGMGRTSLNAWRAKPVGLALGVELCAMYWHFLLFVWLGLFVLLAGWANDFIEICRQLLT